MKNDKSRTDSKPKKQSKSKSAESEKKSTAKSAGRSSETKSTLSAESSQRSSTKRSRVSEKSVKKDSESTGQKLSSLEISDLGPEAESSSGHNDTGRCASSSDSAPKTSSRPNPVKLYPISKKIEASLLKFITENKDAPHYVDFQFSNFSIIKILDVKDNEYFVTLDELYLMVNLKKNSVKNFGDIFQCGIDMMMNIPWELE